MPTIVSRRRRPLMIARHVSPGLEAVGFAEQLAGQHFVGPCRIDPPAAAQVHVVQRAAVPRSGSEISRPVAGSAMPGTSSVTSATTRVETASTPGIAASARPGCRRALQRCEDVGETRAARSTRCARALQRIEVRQVRHEHRHARGNHRAQSPAPAPSSAQRSRSSLRSSDGQPRGILTIGVADRRSSARCARR